MTILTDDLIRKAIDAVLAKRGEVLNGAASSEYEVAGIYARAALQAVLPDVVEMAARTAESRFTTGPLKTHAIAHAAAHHIARAIRSLLNKEDNANG